MTLHGFTKRFRVDNPDKFRLSACDPAECYGLTVDKEDAQKMLAQGIEQLAELQERLYASDSWSVLIILQAMDAAGKDSVIKHVMAGLNPQGVEVHPFKQPSTEELDHNFLWRAARRLPERGRIGIFNRSYYEEVLVLRVHPELVEQQKLPASLRGKDMWQKRFEDIRAFERHLVRNGTLVLKFFLHVSKDEQRKRFLDRIDEPAKRWKFSMADVNERKLWKKYQDVYEDMIRNTSRPDAPWYVVPADHKWFTRMVIAGVLVRELRALNLDFPRIKGKALKELQKAHKALKAER
jgi:PPK2 family polyphosphate:nucleotide phosphotransferase